jgi:hypothetical protein
MSKIGSVILIVAPALLANITKKLEWFYIEKTLQLITENVDYTKRKFKNILLRLIKHI